MAKDLEAPKPFVPSGFTDGNKLDAGGIEQMRFGLAGSGPLAKAVLDSNAVGTMRQLIGGGATPTTTIPVGTISPYAGTSAPANWLLCDGSAVSRATYAALFDVTGTAYGVGDGSTTFNVPDLRGRIVVGSGTGAQQGVAGSGVITGGAALTARTRGQFFGDERTELHTHIQNSHNHTQDSHNHTQDSHNHTQNSHSHNMSPSSAAGYNSGTIGNVMAAGGSYWVARSAANTNDVNTVGSTTGTTATNQASTATNQASTATNQAQTATNQNTFAGTGANTQPSVVTTYIIKAIADVANTFGVALSGVAGGMLSGTYPNPSVASISGLAAGGDLTGTYPNPTITNIANAAIHNSNTTLSFRTSSTERMGIDASGRVTKPFQPYFKAHSPGGISVANGGKWPLTIVTTNVGSSFNTGTYLFTAPVAGVYVFGGTWRVDANLAYIHTLPFVNGLAAQDNGELPGLTGFGTSVSGFTATSFYYTRYLSANDNIYFALYNNAGGTYNVYQQSYLTGFLMS